MKLSEARKRWHKYVFWWKDNLVSGPNEWAKVLLRRDMEIDRLESKNAALKRIYRRIQEADHPMLTLPVEMTVAMAEMTALFAKDGG